jgi:hypothetical protein
MTILTTSQKRRSGRDHRGDRTRGEVMSADLKFHPCADIFPLMEGEEFDALVTDIKANGLLERIILFDGMILDGRNRYRALLAAGLDPATANKFTIDGADLVDDPAAFVVSANLHRRHLTAEDKRDVIAKLLKAAPEKSDRQIGKQIGASHHTVEAVRTKMEGRGQIAHVETRIDSKGRKQAAKKPTKKAGRKQPVRKPVKHDDRVISPELGDRVGRLAYRLIRLDIDLARELADLILQRGVVERLWADLGTGIEIEGSDADDTERTL